MIQANKSHKHYRTCHLCEAMCGLEIEHNGKDILAIRGDVDDPFSQGHICPKGVAIQDLYRDPDRLKFPLRKNGTDWVQIGWDEALSETTERLIKVRERHGSDAVGVYLGNPNVHNHGTQLALPGLLNVLSTRNLYSSSSMDQLAHQFVAYFMFGHDFLMPVPDIDHTEYFLLLGSNPIVSNGSIMGTPNIRKRLRAIQERGGKLVVIDPRRNETARIADHHHFIRPGTDVLFLLALIHVVFAEDLANPARLSGITRGMDELRNLVREFTPDRVAEHTGIDPKTISQIARDFTAGPAAVCHGRLGTCIQEFGGLTQWLIAALNVITGNLDRRGGAMFTLPAIDGVSNLVDESGTHGHYDQWRSRVRGLPEFSGELPAATLSDEILTGGEGQIRAMITIAGNPVLSTPNSRKLDKALGQLDFMVSVDFYINETTRRADIILPPTMHLEHSHYDLIFHTVAVRNTAKYSPALFKGEPGTRHCWEILQELQKRIEHGKPILSEDEKDIMTCENLEGILDRGLRHGPYGSACNKDIALSLDKLKQTPHGIDLAPLTPCLPERLFTKDKQIQLCPPVLVKDLVRVRDKWLNKPGVKSHDKFLLIGRRQIRSINSWMHNSERLVKGREQCTALINSNDARHLQLVAGDLLRIKSRVGSIEVPAEITDDIMPGTVSVPHGWGHNLTGIRLNTARQHAGVNVNLLTDDTTVDPLCGSAVANGVPVQLERIS